MNLENIYITSDSHFLHKNITKYCNRPYDFSWEGVKEMNEDLLKQFDELPENSIVINCGDVFLNGSTKFEELSEIVKRMKNGNKELWLILGNHDREVVSKVKNFQNFKTASEVFIKAGFDKVFPFPILLEDKYLLSHEPVYLNPGNNITNYYGHLHDTFVTTDYFNHECENYAMMERVKEHPELTKQTNLDIDTEKLSRTDLTIDPKNYFNVCWDAHHKILKFTDIV